MIVSYTFGTIFKRDRCDTAGAVASDDRKGDASPASTVPADDEAAVAQARASYQSAKMKTPEDKIRRLPATPKAPLSREVQSVEIFRGEGDKTTNQTCSSRKSRPLKARKTMKRRAKKTKKPAKTAKEGADTAKTRKQEPIENTPVTSPTTTSGNSTTSPGTSTNTPDASTPGSRTSAPQTAQPARKASVELGSPDLTENRSPAPGAVAGVLNRAQTTDLVDAQNMVKTGAEAALQGGSGNETKVRDGTRLRIRNKDYHNRRMRFYRSLERRKKSEKLAILFEEWNNCNEDWTSSSFVVRMRERTTERQKGGRRWMTEGDIIDKYSKGRTLEEAKQIAREIVMGKETCKHMRNTHIRAHPDAPLRQDMRLFLIWDEEFECTETDSIVEALFESKDSDEHGGKDKKKKRKRETSSSSQQSDKSSSSESSNSSSSAKDRRKNKKKKAQKGKKSKQVKHKRRDQGKKKPSSRKEVKDESSSSESRSESEEDPGAAAAKKAKEEKEKEREAAKQAEKDRKLAEKEEQKEKKRLENQQKKEQTKEINKKKAAVRSGSSQRAAEGTSQRPQVLEAEAPGAAGRFG
eukprot:s1382_g5.t1